MPLKSTTVAPPGGWVFIDQDTGLVFQERLWSSLLGKVAAHRKHKGNAPWEGPELEDLIQSQMCLRLSDRWCTGERDYIPDRSGEITGSVLMSAHAALMAWLQNPHTVSQEEVDRRTAICKKCIYNRPATGCACGTIMKVLNTFLGAAKVPNDPDLHMCGVCRCLLRAKVHAPKEVVDASNNGNIRFPTWCWQDKLS
jgi:hypothetical protein